jgi:hypothetical protein
MQRRNFIPAVAASVWAIARHPFEIIRPIPHEATMTWLTQNGESIRICDMTDEHLRNCIFYLVRLRAISSRNWYKSLYGLHDMTRMPQYEIMLREATRRKLAWI